MMINGPVNIIRLEGNINKIKKVIYLFLDIHYEVGNQTQCSDVFSRDIQEYFVDAFRNLNNNRIYDFFLEITPSDIAEIKSFPLNIVGESKEKYIREVVKKFVKIFNFNPVKNKVLMSKILTNVRLHYFDLRDYYEDSISLDRQYIETAVHDLKTRKSTKNINFPSLCVALNELQDHLLRIADVLQNEPVNITKSKKTIRIVPINKFEIESIEYLTHKIKNLYHHDDVKKIMNQLLDDIIRNFYDVVDRIEKVKKNIKRIQPSKLATILRDLCEYDYESLFARITDIYFLRRFIDKDYIKNAVVYSGANHSCYYVNVLTKYFGFKITHYSYSKIKQLSKLNETVKKYSIAKTIEILLPASNLQCSDLSNFPKDFL